MTDQYIVGSVLESFKRGTLKGGGASETAYRFPAMLLPRGGYIAVLLEAYLDESQHEKSPSPYQTVGGYLFPSKQAQIFSGQWDAYLKRRGLAYFRMSECNMGWGEFKKLKDNEPERDKIARSMIARVKKHSAFAFAAAVNVEAHARIFSKYNEFPSAYTLGCFACMMLIRNWADRIDYQGDIAYTFESGDDEEGAAAAYFSKMFKKEKNRKFYRFANLSFADKEKVPLLSAGDLMAWHWSKRYANEYEGREVRRDLLALIRPTDMCMEYNEAELKKTEEAALEGGMLTLKAT